MRWYAYNSTVEYGKLFIDSPKINVLTYGCESFIRDRAGKWTTFGGVNKQCNKILTIPLP